MKRLGIAAFLLAVPLVCAAVTASVTYAWNSFTTGPQPAYAGGADTKEGFVVTSFRADSGRDYLAVMDYSEYMGDKSRQPFLTVYEVVRKGDGSAELYLVGSRCIGWDRGFPMIGFNEKKIESPDALKKKQNPPAEKSAAKDD